VSENGATRLPSAQPTVLPAYRRGDQLIIFCPHCRREHYHGAAGGDGSRSAHCTDDRSPFKRRGYWLREVRGPVMWLTA
jgi:hypothetical protein